VTLPLRVISFEAGYSRFFGGGYLRNAGFPLTSASFLYGQAVVGF
jgi:hypothetical protein